MLRMIGRVLTRKKVLDPVSTQDSRLARVLNTYDLTFLGVGSTLGVGMYVLVGHVAKDIAGPAVLLSFLIAAVASAFAGLCYAEFGARAPRAGSAYIYSYVCVGEFIAFVIGWNLILEYVIGSASVARGLSLYIDTLANNTLKHTFIDIAPMHVSFMSSYFDFLSFAVSFLLSLALAFGMKESSMVNNIFTTVNLGVVVFIVIAGSIEAHTSNWAINPADVPANITNTTNIGTGYFFPFGIEGMIKGAATCFYGFVGFDCIATTGEEVKNPQRAIPLSIILSLLIIFVAYMGTSTVVTLMIPYYSQDVNAPIPHAFEVCNFTTGKWIVAVGAIFGLCISLFGAMFPLPRVIYAMASDGIIFRFLGYVSTKFQTPVIGTLVAGVLTGLMAALFELKHLVDMMSIGTLLAYTIVAASVLLLRYAIDESVDDANVDMVTDSDDSGTYMCSQPLDDQDPLPLPEREHLAPENVTIKTVMKQFFNCSGYRVPNKVSEKLVTVEVFIYCICCIFIGIGAILLQRTDSLSEGTPYIVLTSVFSCIAVVIVISISRQPVSRTHLNFKVPFVPFIPAVSILVNIYLMLMLDTHTWIRFGVWMAVGLPTYYYSVTTALPAARNDSIVSMSSNKEASEKRNGFMNGGYFKTETLQPEPEIKIEAEPKKQENGTPVGENGLNSESGNILESADKVLHQFDAMLDHESSNINDAVNLSGDSKCLDVMSCQSFQFADTTLDSSNCDENLNVPVVWPVKRELIVADVHQCNSSVCSSPPVSNLPDPLTQAVDQKEIIELLKLESNPEKNESSEGDASNVNDTICDAIENNQCSEPTVENVTENSVVDREDKENGIDDIVGKVEASNSTNNNMEGTAPSGDDHTIPNVNKIEKINNDNASEESGKDHLDNKAVESNYAIPIPPPFPKNEQSVNINIPRPKISAQNLKSVRLKSSEENRPKIPPTDYEENEAGNDSPPEDLPTGHLKKGSVEFSKFLEKLSNKLQKPSPVKYTNSFTTPEKKPNVKKKIEVPRDSVDQDNINKTNAKKMLESLLTQQLNRMTETNQDCYLINTQDSLSNITPENESNSDSDLGIESNASKINGDISDDKKPPVVNNYSDYRKNMDEIIKTIRLRKVDSFKEACEEDDARTSEDVKQS